MRTRMWLKLVEERSVLLKEVLKQAYYRAAGLASDEWQEEVLLNENGNITFHSYPVTSIPAEVMNGEAIYVGTVKRFNYTPPADGREDKHLEVMANQWAEEQLYTLLQDLRNTAEFEEIEVMYV